MAPNAKSNSIVDGEKVKKLHLPFPAGNTDYPRRDGRRFVRFLTIPTLILTVIIVLIPILLGVSPFRKKQNLLQITFFFKFSVPV